MKRLLSCTSEEMLKLNGTEIKQAIKASEGRVILSENVVARDSLLPGLTNGEIAAAFGADMILLNAFDCNNPQISGLPETDDPIRLLRKLTGRLVGVNLEPVDYDAEMMEDRDNIAGGRQATKDTYLKAKELGFDYICLTGNPGVGVTNRTIEAAIKEAKEYFGGLIIAGKMHSAGVDEPLVDLKVIEGFVEAGADIILLPAVNTVPGLTEQMAFTAVERIHKLGALALSAIGTSQEGSDEATIREMAIVNKRCGFDIQHIGDAGFGCMAIPENITALSIAVRGKRHTYSRIAASIRR